MNHDVRLRVKGSLLERLLERAVSQGAVFASVRRIGAREMEFSTDERSARILISLCKRYGMYAQVIACGGRTAAWRRLRARWTLALGVALCLIAARLSLGRLWRVDVEFIGPAAALGDRAEVAACLRDEGVSTGMLLSKIDEKLLQKRLMADAGDYSFVGVRLQGVRLLVEAAPEVPSPELYRRQYARDLVAARDGVVVAVKALSGTACVKAGDTVRAGQTLIRGEEEKTKEETQGVAALGEVIARCWYEGGAQGSLTQRVSLRSGRTRQDRRLRLLGITLPIHSCEAFSQEEIEVERIPVAGLYLPLELEKSVHYETTTQSVAVDEGALRERLGALARAEALAALSRDDISIAQMNAWEECTRQGNTLRVRAVYEVNTDIAVTRDTFISQSEEVY